MYDFLLINADTDSLTIGKRDGSEFSEEERDKLLAELNSLFPPKINWADDGYYKKVIVLAAKNYVLWDGNKLKTKGSGLKSGSKETALREFIQDTVQSILHDKNDYVEVYHRYIKEALDVKDIKRWSSRKTLSQTTFSSERTNESKIIQAIENSEYKVGDRVWLFFKEDGSLELAEKFNGSYDRMVLVKKLFNTSKLFSTVLDHGLLYKNYSLKKNREELEKLG